MSAEKKPGDPAEIPPFLQARRGASKSPAAPAKPAASEEPSSGIPFFLRGGKGKPADKLAPAEKPASPIEDKAPANPTSPDFTGTLPGGLLTSDEVQKAMEAAQAERLRAEQQAEAERLAFVEQAELAAKAKEPPPSDKPAYKPIDWDNAADIFDHMVTGIRRERADTKREERERKRNIESDWLHVISSMQQLQQKVKGHKKLIYFNISRDQREVSIKLVDESSRHKFRMITMTRDHPSGKYEQMGVVWLIEFAGRERYFAEPKEAMAELVTSIAATLA